MTFTDGTVRGRLLAVVFRGEERAALDGLRAVVGVARAESACIRVACFRPLPPPRVDRYDRVVVDRDREMERITVTTVEAFERVTRLFHDVPIEMVVRFGAPLREVELEVETFGPDLIAFFVSPASSRLRSWLGRQRLTERAGLRALVVETPRAPRGAPISPPAPVLP
jgi:hypothetical protein